ncbi:hypothetical protein [Coxiella burnetii]|uniref:Uncharacterized protein n=2 Tax=Coxiella burnetii TaxID=777 RepID=Q83E01_COXBU|nr:hypothetical protein [Coxiella burnetii]NP_819568.1 hypothetical protein CBU_0536 [Coxiella burnetii RSA 493]AAO90082.1 hypothetical protein CBU_0536 [Coxiella burnetii RSA 493]ABS77229.1 hypothetical protein CBUD_1526 [Coxiella burnetii Dugway 5J108-111]ABX78437.1 hypothetical protein COXBURSA331_A0651 [Coxiella burnetii RSA 331]ACJ18758.1 hypothetical protein CbuG_1458 [Coxiella burnetii CbuG_Q212]ACJ20481.1 hypothetical protein CbuK_1300 [Coxiella burnetii CbuK_Q154]
MLKLTPMRAGEDQTQRAESALVISAARDEEAKIEVAVRWG